MREDLPIWDLHIYPTYAVHVKQRQPGSRSKSELQLKNEDNLRDNKPRTDELGSSKRKMSSKSVRRLTNSINWLVASSKTKFVFDKESGKRYNFKINFVTLTLPSLSHGVSDHKFKSVLLHNFVNTCRYKFDLKNFVWKVETQANGNIHAHFTCDTFMHWRELRKVWNKILIKNGAMEAYTMKHSAMNLEQYLNAYSDGSAAAHEKCAAAFHVGVSERWTNPNTTDVHAVHKVKDIAAYLAKYMSKSDEDRREIKGRLWSCSALLASTNKLVVEMVGYHDQDLIKTLCHQLVKFKPIQTFSEVTRRLTTIGEIFFFKLSDWGTILKGRLLEFYNLHRFQIRHNISPPHKYDPAPLPYKCPDVFSAKPSLSALQINLTF
jgi:hypothetical protein